jgi:hypothetical protein
MTYQPQSLIDKLFRNKEGRIVIIQRPNLPLWGWVVTMLVTPLLADSLDTAMHRLAQALLIIWAYEEARYGDSLFRRLLGGAVLIFVVRSLFA